jgi:hypothetical protein
MGAVWQSLEEWAIESLEKLITSRRLMSNVGGYSEDQSADKNVDHKGQADKVSYGNEIGN